ncbi:hypothetical protein [Serpentinicella alkaliphila]|uniref:Cobalamin-dependent methionine synthase-like protein n=1 Tax=Serpentinicella alkaliphila TaxID=1734049 RepID=A0A4R2TIN9_9FIRM|nr:hypothetical protein [Serpentinicella alkaliphila]QUH24625.1 hypothetical protein HZR23_01660 [Serpentinicella alkaliphila]TCQ02626.1 cobalamin-dependent methionine synthase-like protein [Serpentinicella alkaliphila]
MSHKFNIQLNKDEILRYLGYKNGMDIPIHLDELIDKSISNSYELIEPVGEYRTSRIKGIKGSNILFDEFDFKIHSEDIATLLKGCDYASILAVTIGNDIQNHIDLCFSHGEYTEALIFDAIGSDAAEQATEYVNQLIILEASEQEYILTDRFSPGYGDFTLDFQKQLLLNLKADNFGIHVTETNIMIPRKSVTAIVGWTKGNKIIKTNNKCNTCNKNDCIYRYENSCLKR